MATVFNTADGTTRQEHWFRSFDLSNTVTNAVVQIKSWDYSVRTFYIEEIAIACISSTVSGKPALWDSSLSTAHKKICGMGLKQDTGGGASFVLDFKDDPMIFRNNNEFSVGSGLCFSAGSFASGAFGWIKGYNG